MRYVSTHPMFGPTFANLSALSTENAIVITEGDYMGRIFFLDLFRRLGLHVHEYSFEEHDEAMAYSLSVPFISTFIFSAVMKHQDAPGTTLQAPPRHSPRSAFRGRHPAEGNPLQPPHQAPRGRDTGRTETVDTDNRRQGRGRHARLPQQDKKEPGLKPPHEDNPRSNGGRKTRKTRHEENRHIVGHPRPLGRALCKLFRRMRRNMARRRHRVASAH